MPNVNQPMMVVRKRLSSTEISNPDFRIEDDVVQQTGDGGVTWVDSPANDVRHAPAWRLPPVVADDQKCQAAANMTRFLVLWFEELLPILSAAGSGWALLSTLILLFVVLGPFALVVIMLDVAATLLGIGATAIGAAFTTEVFDQLTCIFYCNIGEDGQVSAEQLASINSDVDDQIGGIAATVLHLIFALVGEVGVSNWGARGDAPADCSGCDCGWVYCWLDGDGLADWTTPADLLDKIAGEYNAGDDSVDGTVINPQNNVWANMVLVENLHVNWVRVTYTNVNTGGEGSTEQSLNLDYSDGVEFIIYDDAGGVDQVHTFDVGGDVTYLGLVFTAQVSMKIQKVEVGGSGTPPSSGTDCTPE